MKISIGKSENIEQDLNDILSIVDCDSVQITITKFDFNELSKLPQSKIKSDTLLVYQDKYNIICKR